MSLSEKEILSIVYDRLPDFRHSEILQPLEGGNLNHVWRLEGQEKNLIIKVAPPYIASDPDVPLSPERIQFEAKALKQFQEGNLQRLSSKNIRPPVIEFYDHSNHLLVMEDVGVLPHLGEAEISKIHSAESGRTLGEFIARLHKQTYEDPELKKQFNNVDIQETRLAVQYRPASKYAQKGGLKNTGDIREITESLGEDLLQTGCCLIMGDLWPPSILLDDNKIRLIDWEFVHFGRPLQDIGHFAAHCWMLAHTAGSPKEKELYKKLWSVFWQAYQNEWRSDFSSIVTAKENKDMTTHIGAEILVRVTGPFKDGYVYRSFAIDHILIKEAVQKAKQLILSNDLSVLWT